METIAYRYDADANPAGALIPGVPLRDLTLADLDQLTEHQRKGIPLCGFYTLVIAPPEPEPEPAAPRGRRRADIAVLALPAGSSARN
jgi:hypothetical protein